MIAIEISKGTVINVYQSSSDIEEKEKKEKEKKEKEKKEKEEEESSSVLIVDYDRKGDDMVYEEKIQPLEILINKLAELTRKETK